jgi:transposase
LDEHSEWLLALVAGQPDLTLDEVVAAMRREAIAGSRSAVWRFFDRHGISFKKNSARGGARPGGRGRSARALETEPGIA